jgi:hypothetical protein
MNGYSVSEYSKEQQVKSKRRAPKDCRNASVSSVLGISTAWIVEWQKSNQTRGKHG